MQKANAGSNRNTINIGILGLGKVGSGTVNVLNENYDDILRRTGFDIIIKKAAVHNLEKPRICSTEGITITNDAYDVINDPEIDIIVELIGGIELPKQYILEAISQEKHIITANKALIATHGNEIFSYAQDKNVIIAFEAAVGGGIPIIKILREGLAANKIKSVMGILNGTGNFILTKMYNEGITFIDALNLAQKLGYAESDPTMDISGVDTAHKLTILSSIAFGMPLRYSDIYIEGISEIKPLDLLCAKEMGYTIKHIAYAEKNHINIELFVYPILINNTHPLAKIDGVTNAIAINANAIGDSFYHGAGAGSAATASSVIADLIDIIRGMDTAPQNRVSSFSFQPTSLINFDLNSIENLQFSYYISFTIKDTSLDITKNIEGIAANHCIKLFKLKKMPCLIDIDHSSWIIITHQTSKKMIDLFLLELQTIYANDRIVKLRIWDDTF